jgi:amidohydrolase
MNPDALPASLFETVTRVRRLIHQNPELSNQEIETPALLRAELERAGLRGIRPVAKTGMVADVGSPAGPRVAVRADLDALPVQEQTGLSYTSQRPGIMHACGHDAHAAILLGLALAAKRRERELPGTLRLIFQPAEESEPLGARQVVNAGLLDDVSAAIALHVSPDLDVGTVGLCSGPAMACSDEFTIDIAGTGGHAGWPHLGRDAITAAATVIGAMQTIVSRRADPRSPLVVHVGKVAGGRSGNVIADQVRMDGTIRALREDDRQMARAELTTLVDGICRAAGVHGTVSLRPGEPVLHNDARVMQAFREAAADMPVKAQVCELAQATMNSEDFAFYSQAVPSGMAWLGVRDTAADLAHPLHHPGFRLDERALRIGVELLLCTGWRLLRGHARSAHP